MNLDFELQVGNIENLDTNKNFYELLEVDQKATSLTIKNAFIKQKQMYNRNALALYSLSDKPSNDQVLSQLEEAYNTLSCEFAREDYDRELNGFSKNAHTSTKTKLTVSKVKSESYSVIDRESQYDLYGDQFGFGSGEQLKSFRAWLGIELQEVQQVTKISYTTLESIENESFQLLPDIVYVRGFLRTCLRYYGLPKREEFEKLFMERLKNWKQTSNQ